MLSTVGGLSGSGRSVFGRLTQKKRNRLGPDMDTHEAGRRGGTARAKNLTPEQRREAARKAALARWAKRAPHYTPENKKPAA
jgi:hypothetical protein